MSHWRIFYNNIFIIQLYERENNNDYNTLFDLNMYSYIFKIMKLYAILIFKIYLKKNKKIKQISNMFQYIFVTIKIYQKYLRYLNNILMYYILQLTSQSHIIRLFQFWKKKYNSL